MAIKFHCEHCGKVVSAPDKAGGKRGRCPACQGIVYVPSPETDGLDIAPLDESEERRRQDLIEKDLAAEHDLLAAQGRRDAAPEPPEAPSAGGAAEGGIALPEIDSVAGGASEPDPRDALVEYLRHMASGQLEQANAIVDRLRADPASARSAVDRLLNDPIGDPRLADVPPPVVAGFIKQLQDALK